MPSVGSAVKYGSISAGRSARGAKSASRIRTNSPSEQPKPCRRLPAFFIQPRSGAHQVGEPETGGERPRPLVRAVVEHVAGRGAGVGPDQLEHVRPRVVQHGERLAAHGQEDVQRRVARRSPGRHQPLVRGLVEPSRAAVHAQRDHVVGHGERHERQERPGVDGAEEDEPELADQQRAEAGQRRAHDQRDVPVRVAVLLGVARRGGRPRPGRLAVRGRRAPRSQRWPWWCPARV